MMMLLLPPLLWPRPPSRARRGRTGTRRTAAAEPRPRGRRRRRRWRRRQKRGRCRQGPRRRTRGWWPLRRPLRRRPSSRPRRRRRGGGQLASWPLAGAAAAAVAAAGAAGRRRRRRRRRPAEHTARAPSLAAGALGLPVPARWWEGLMRGRSGGDAASTEPRGKRGGSCRFVRAGVRRSSVWSRSMLDVSRSTRRGAGRRAAGDDAA